MNKISRIATMCLALASISVFLGLTTAGSTVAQGGGPGQSGKPATEVKVINGASESVPVVIQGTASVNVGNTIGNPVPVTVTNPNPIEESGTRIVIRDTVMIPNGGFNGSAQVYVVPDGKYLVLEMATFHVERLGKVGDHELTIGSLYEGNTVQTFIAPDGGRDWAEYGSEKIEHLAGAGSGVNVTVSRNPINSEGIPLFATVVLTGRLYNVPSE